MTKRKTPTKTKAKPKSRSKKTGSGTTPATQPPKTKAGACLALLRRKEGATIEQLQKVTGWQSHSVRGFLSGKVKKMDGAVLTSDKPADGMRRYHVQSA